jgi:hypothetical protein
MAQGIALTIGLNAVDPCCYDGQWQGVLQSAERDAQDMYAIACTQGFQASLLLGKTATREAVQTAITQASEILVAGDMLLVSFAGHGGLLPDFSSDEQDCRDETWCLYNGHLVDDELDVLWGRFAAGVRILVISDSCHSGTVTRGAEGLPRAMPLEVALATYKVQRDFYRGLSTLHGCSAEPAATVRLLSACSDNETTSDGLTNGRFTAALKQVWQDGCFGGDYNQFYEHIRDRLRPQQSPNHSIIGQWNEAYDQQRPFDI